MLTAQLASFNMSAFKIIITFLQVISQVGISYDVHWPVAFLRFNTGTSVVNLDFVKISSVDCVLQDAVSYYNVLLVVTLIPLGVIAIMVPITWACFMVYRGITLHQARRDSLNMVISNALTLAFVLYTGISTRILQIFDCQEFDDGTSWLRNDYSVQCYTARWNGFVVYAAFMMLVYPLGLPVITFLVVYKNRKQLDNTVVREKYGFLYQDFKREGFIKYWEGYYMLRKLLLTALVVYFGQGTIWQAAVACLISLAALLLHLTVLPFRDERVSQLEFASLLVIFLTFFFAVLIRTGDLTDDNRDSIGILLIILEVALFVFTIFQVVRYMLMTLRDRSLRRKSERMSARVGAATDDSQDISFPMSEKTAEPL